MLGVECGQAQYFIPILGMLLGNAISGVSVGLSTLLEELATGLLPFVRRSYKAALTGCWMLRCSLWTGIPFANLLIPVFTCDVRYCSPKATGLLTLPCVSLRTRNKTLNS